ncbi:MAG: hypothetical protein WC943_10105, partial [Elusimicrobiota bacterium]
IQINAVEVVGESYAVGTASGLFRLDRRLTVRGRRPEAGAVSALAVDGAVLYVGSECGLFKEERGRWSAVPLLEDGKGGCDGSRSVRVLCLNVGKAGKGGRGRKILYASLEDTATENVEPVGLFAYDIAKATAARVTALQGFGDPPVTAMLCSGDRVLFGTDAEQDRPHPGQVFAYDPVSGGASLVSEGMPRVDEDDAAEITALASRGDLTLVGRYAGHGTGQCVLAAGRGTVGKGLSWSCVLKSEADLLEGVSSIQALGRGFLVGSGLMANVDAARVFRLGSDLAVSEASALPVAGQLVTLKAAGGRVFLGTTEGLVVLPESGFSARPPRP